MKLKWQHKVGRFLMKLQPLKLVVIDDVESYFNKNMLDLANTMGFSKIERLYYIDKKILQRLLVSPPDIIILDIKGIVNSEIGKDGFDIARTMMRETNTYVVVTSAHRYKLKNENSEYDYIINNRLLTAVDFLEELHSIVSDAFELKINWYKNIAFRIGFGLIKKILVQK